MVKDEENEKEEETFHSSIISLSHLLPLSFSSTGYRALSDFLFSTLPLQIHMNNSSYLADPRLQTLPSFLGIRCTPPYCLPFFIIFFFFLPLIISMPSIHVFLPQAEKMNSMQGIVQIYSVNTLTCISLFTVNPLC